MEALRNGIELTGTLYTSAQGDAKDKLAYAEQIWDDEQQKHQSEINKKLAESIEDIPNADEEDITVTADNKLQLKDRDSSKGMGYKILRLPEDGILTQEMINEPNTIYEIRYDFDLNGLTITIPENCVLKFEGGSLSSGTVQLTNTKISSIDAKIFSNISFIGDVYGQVFEMGWFVDLYLTEYKTSNVTIDSSVQINEAFACGAKLFHFNLDNKYYYLKNPITINGDISIVGDLDTNTFPSSSRTADSRRGCIYSNEIITLFIYNFISDFDSTPTTNVGMRRQRSLIISGLTFYCNKTYSNLNDRNIPIVQINNKDGITNSALWGLVFNCNIAAIDCQIEFSPDEGVTTYTSFVPNYTALQLNAVTGNITYSKLSGFYNHTFYGVVVTRTENTWVTDTTIKADTYCVKGAKADCGMPFSVFGSHQPIQYFGRLNKEAYFEVPYLNIYGFVWDRGVGNDEKGYTTRYVGGNTSDIVRYNTQSSYLTNNDEHLSSMYYEKMHVSGIIPNYLREAYFTPSSVRVSRCSVTVNNKDIKACDLPIYNIDNLFPSILSKGGKGMAVGTTHSRHCYLHNNTGSALDVNIEFEIIINLGGLDLEIFRNLYYIATNDTVIDMYASNLEDSEYVLKSHAELSTDLLYWDKYWIIPTNIDGEQYLKIKVKCSLDNVPNSAYKTLPILYFPNYLLNKENLLVVPTPNRPVINDGTGIANIKVYDSYLNKVIQYNGVVGRWETLDGRAAVDFSGTSNKRPTTLTNHGNDIGFQYFDTTINRLVWWDGTKWIDPAAEATSWKIIR